ncbi:DUF2637 domain-containing protein [Flindersiella endophytica]
MTESSLPSPSERIIKWSTAAAVLCVATVAAVVSYDHAYALVRTYGEDGWTARLVPLTVDGLIYASSMVLLHSARRRLPVPRLARWLLGVGIAATLAANAAHGLGHGPVGAMVAAWPAVALVGTYELLMLIIRRTGPAPAAECDPEPVPTPLPAAEPTGRPVLTAIPDVPEPDPHQVRAAEAFAEKLAAGIVPSVRAIRNEMRVGQPRAQHIRSYLTTLVAAQNEGQA